MGLKALDHLVIAVSEWERSNAFYRDVLGVAIVEVEYGRVAYDLPGGQRLNVHGPGSTPHPRAADPVRPGNSDLCFVWDGAVADAVAHLERLGIAVELGPVPRTGAAGPGTSVYFRDPDGSLLELISYVDQTAIDLDGEQPFFETPTSLMPEDLAITRSRDLVDRLAHARIGGTYNQYARSALRQERLRAYLESRAGAAVILVGEAAGYRGARLSGVPFTSERQLTGRGPAEASATVVHRVLRELGVEHEVLLWNVVPTHPGTATSNRAPTRAEIECARPFLDELVESRAVIAVGRVAAAALGAPYVRHPSHGGAAAFACGLRHMLGR